MYNYPLSCDKLNSNVTDWFPIESGVHQGDSLSPTLFAKFINVLASEMKLDIGIDIENGNICILLFADDIVILAEDEKKLQILLDFTNEWCQKWRMKINNDKTKVIIHFRKISTKIINVTFQLDEHEVKKVDRYKYLGVYLDEYLDYETIANTLSGAAGRALGSIISKFKSFINVGLKTYSKLYYSGVVPILDFCSGVWGFQKMDTCNKVQPRVLRYFLGIHSKTHILAL